MPSAWAVARLLRESLRGEVLGYFEVALQMPRCAREDLLPERRLGNCVEREITADDGKRLCVLLYALLVQFLLGDFATCEVALGAIHLPAPSFVPRRAG